MFGYRIAHGNRMVQTKVSSASNINVAKSYENGKVAKVRGVVELCSHTTAFVVV